MGSLYLISHPVCAEVIKLKYIKFDNEIVFLAIKPNWRKYFQCSSKRGLFKGRAAIPFSRRNAQCRKRRSQTPKYFYFCQIMLITKIKIIKSPISVLNRFFTTTTHLVQLNKNFETKKITKRWRKVKLCNIQLKGLGCQRKLKCAKVLILFRT